MISAELKNNLYLIRFKGAKNQFNEYITNVMKLPGKQWSVENNCWVIPKESHHYLERYFKKIEYLEEVKEINRAKTTASDYADMGKSMKLQPYDYQKEAIKFAIDTHETLIVYPCGSGKTPCGIGIYIEAKERGIISGPGMIIVKASLKTQWLHEISKFSDLKCAIIQSKSDISNNIKTKIKRRQAKINNLDKIANAKEIKALKAEISDLKLEIDTLFASQFNDLDLYVLNYETLKNPDVRIEMHRRKINFIFADEIHYVKNRTSKRSEALYEFGNSKIKIGATATPVGKNPEDLYGIFKFISPALFPSFSKFASMYVKYAGYGRVAGVKNAEHLVKKYAPHVIVKTKEEISDQLPDLVVIQRYCDMTNDQWTMYEKIILELDDLKKQDKAIRARCKNEHEAKNSSELRELEARILALQTFAQELCDAPEILATSVSNMAKNYVPTDLSSPKLDLLTELVEEIIESGEKVCIFSRFKTMQPIITREIHKQIDKNIKIAYVNGELNDTARFKEVYDKFRDDEDYKVLIMTDAGAEGLNLSKCKYLIEFDLADSYGIQTQRHGRVERSDSIHDNVFVYQLIADGSWDTIAQKIIEKKEGYDTELIKSLAKPI